MNVTISTRPCIRVFTLLALVLVAGFVSAQNVDHKVLGIETGVLYSYDVGTGTIGNGTSVALNLTLSDSLTAGFVFLKGDGTGIPANSSLLSLSYGLADRFGMSVMLGQNATAATVLTGLGMYFNIFERKLQDAVSTVLKAKIDYIFAPGALNTGDLTIGLCVSVGI